MDHPVSPFERRACESCEVLENGAPRCWVCGGPTIPAHQLRPNTSTPIIRSAQ